MQSQVKGLIGGMAVWLMAVSLRAQHLPELGQILAYNDVVDRVESIGFSATGDFFDTAQTIVAGSRGRHVSSYAVDVTWAPQAMTSLDWTLNTHYPFPSEWTYTEVLASVPIEGRFAGVDGFRPTPEGPLPGARIAARTKLMWLSLPPLLFAQATNAREIEGRPNAVAFTAAGTDWIARLDEDSRFPIRISTIEADPLFGSVRVSMDYFGWVEAMNNFFVPTRLEYRVDSNLIRREQRTNFDIQLAQESVAAPYSPPLHDARFAKGWTSAHWFMSRIALGGPADRETSARVELLEVGDGIYQVLGSSHHSLVIEGSDGLAVVDAPFNPERSAAVLARLRDRWPDKPVGDLVLTHHHFDHSGGIATFAEAGIAITVPAASRDFFYDALARQGIGAPRIGSVSEISAITVGGRPVAIYDVPTSHAAGVLVVHVPDQALLFNADLYSPGRERQNALWASELQAALDFQGIRVERHVGAHGRSYGTAEDLAQVVAGAR